MSVRLKSILRLQTILISVAVGLLIIGVYRQHKIKDQVKTIQKEIKARWAPTANSFPSSPQPDQPGQAKAKSGLDIRLELDAQRNRFGFRQYRVLEDRRPLEELIAINNAQCFPSGPRDRIANSLFYYDAFLKSLKSIPTLRFVPMKDFDATEPTDQYSVVTFRHDVDADIASALAMSKVEGANGIPGTYYILHTSPAYYGHCEPDGFYRNEAMAELYLGIQKAGCDVALHMDGLHVYQKFDMDGADAVGRELAWMRQRGLKIDGFVSHNSAQAYGCMNMELLMGASRYKYLEYVDRLIPLQVLDPELLRLKYDGDFMKFCQAKPAPLSNVKKGFGSSIDQVMAFNNEAGCAFREGRQVSSKAMPGMEKWQERTEAIAKEQRETLLFDFDLYRFNLYSRNTWAIVTHRKSEPAGIEVLSVNKTGEDILEYIRSLGPGRRLKVDIHPINLGARLNEKSSPELRVNYLSGGRNPELGWFTYYKEVQAWSNAETLPQEYQTYLMPNDFGMIDRARSVERPKDVALRVLMLGSCRVEGLQVWDHERLNQRLEVMLAEELGRPVEVIVMAHSSLGASRLWSWYSRKGKKLKPDIVLVTMMACDIQETVPEVFLKRYGYDGANPPGDYLVSGPDGSIKIIEGTPEFAIHAKDPDLEPAFKEVPVPVALALLMDDPLPPKAADWLNYLKLMYGFFAGEIRRDGAVPFLFLEENNQFDADQEKPIPGYTTSLRPGNYLRRAKAIAEEANAKLIDPHQYFLTKPNYKEKIYYKHDAHWSYWGHLWAAEAIRDHLKKSGILERFRKTK